MRAPSVSPNASRSGGDLRLTAPLTSTEITTLRLLHVVRDVHAPAAAKALLFALVAHRERDPASGRLVMRPSVEELVRATGLSRATVLRTLPILERDGLIVRTANDGRRKPMRYELTIGERSHEETAERSRPETSESSHDETHETSHDETTEMSLQETTRAETSRRETAETSRSDTTPEREVSLTRPRGLTMSPSEDLSADQRSPLPPKGSERESRDVSPVDTRPEPADDLDVAFVAGTASAMEVEAAYREAVAAAKGSPVSVVIRMRERDALLVAIRTHFAPLAASRRDAIERMATAVSRSAGSPRTSSEPTNGPKLPLRSLAPLEFQG